MKNLFALFIFSLFSLKAFAGGEILPQETPAPQVTIKYVDRPVVKYVDRPVVKTVYVDRDVVHKHYCLNVHFPDLTHLVNIELVHGGGCPPPCERRPICYQRPVYQAPMYAPQQEHCRKSLEIHGGIAWISVTHPNGTETRIPILDVQIALQMAERIKSGARIDDLQRQFGIGESQGYQQGRQYGQYQGNFAHYGPQVAPIPSLAPLPSNNGRVDVAVGLPAPY